MFYIDILKQVFHLYYKCIILALVSIYHEHNQMRWLDQKTYHLILYSYRAVENLARYFVVLR